MTNELPPDVTNLPAPGTARDEPAAPLWTAPATVPGLDPEAIWTTRPEMELIYYAAWQHLISPWAVLASVLTRSLTAIPYPIRYRSHWREEGSPLNLMVALVGKSGSGKSLLDEIAAQVINFQGCVIPGLETPRSGEAIPASIGKSRTETDEQGVSRTVVDYRSPSHAHRFFWDEIGKLAAQSKRSGSTMIEYLKELVSGSQLGGQNSAGDGLVIPSRQYRATVTLSVQPRRADALLGSAETEGGLQGRIVWFSLEYPEFATRALPDRANRPAAVTVEAGHWASHEGHIEALPAMNAAHEADKRLSIAGEREDSESHQVLMRAIVAIGLMNLAGRDYLTDSDWTLAGLVMEHSRLTLADVRRQLADDDPNAATEMLEREEALLATLYKRRDEGTSWKKAYEKLSPRGRELSKVLESEGRLARW